MAGFARDWDAYWRNARSGSERKEGGAQDAALEGFWMKHFQAVLPALGPEPQMLDLGAGSGPVIRFALASVSAVGSDSDLHVFALDSSAAALAELRERHRRAACVAADAAYCPFEDRTFDLVTSQFGLEYAGPAAITEAARLVKVGGVLSVVLHLHGGGIYRECAVNLEAINAIRECDLLGCFGRLFETAATKPKSEASNALLRGADEKLAQAVTAAEDVFRRLGKDVASGMLFRLYTDVGHMYRRLGAYEPTEVFNWINVMQSELESYSGRMASMLDAALTPVQLEQAVDRFRAAGLAISLRDTLKIGQAAVPAAWLLVASRGLG